MLNILKADLYRVVKDKLFKAALIICIILAIVIPVGYFFLTWGTTAINMQYSGYQEKDALTLARESMLSSYMFTKFISAPVCPFGVVMGVFLVILLGKDRETCRNKIIVGKSRKEVYFSNVILSLIVYVGFMVIYTLLTYLIGMTCLSLGFDGFNAGQVIGGILLRLLVLVGMALGISFFAAIFHNTALPIVIHVLVGYLSLMIGIFMIAFNANSLSSQNGALDFSLVSAGAKIMSGINFPLSVFAMLGDFSLETILSNVLTVVILGSMFIYLGYILFKTKKLK